MRRFSSIALLVAGCGIEQEFTPITPVMGVLPEALDFGEVVANEEIRSLDAFVNNAGQAVLEAEVTIDGPDAAAFSLPGETTFTVDPDGSVTVPVLFTPTDLRAYEAQLVVQGNDPEHLLWGVPLTGTGRVPYAPEIEVVPVSIDFGDVSVPAVQFAEIRNVGDADLVLDTITQEGAGTFSLVNDPSGSRILPGQRMLLQVQYTPLVPPVGDSGVIEIPSNDADEPVTVVDLVANGGGTFDYPDAQIDCPGVVDLAGPVTVHLDGSASTDAGAPPLTYAWSVVRRPTAADAARQPEPTDAPETDLLIDAAGTWEVQLVVTNADGHPSVPQKCVIEAVPIDQIHVELSWSGPTSDLDLHLADGDAEFYTVPGDVSWCNANPDWGVAGNTDDDPRLDQDDDDGFGPENINIALPADGHYPVRVHLFDDGDDGAVTATVSVFTDGSLAWSGSKVLARNDVWEVGQVNWPEGTFGEWSDAPADDEGVRECR